MKREYKWIIMFLVSIMLTACTTPAAVDIEQEQVLEALQYYTGEIEELNCGEINTLVLTIGEESDILQLYTFTAPQTGTYELCFGGYEDEKNCDMCLEVYDDHADILLDLYNKKDVNTGTVELYAGSTCYAAVYIKNSKKNTAGTCEIDILIEKKDDTISVDLLDGELIKTVGTNRYCMAYTEPERDGYYEFTIDSDSEYGETAIYSIIADDEIIYENEGICELAAGTRYYIVYGVETDDSTEAEIDLRCTYIEYMSALPETMVHTNTVIEYDADQTNDILVYSVSLADPSVKVYDASYGLIAQNTDYNGPYSDNKDDFAAIFHARKGENYYVYISGLRDENCEVHFESYRP